MIYMSQLARQVLLFLARRTPLVMRHALRLARQSARQTPQFVRAATQSARAAPQSLRNAPQLVFRPPQLIHRPPQLIRRLPHVARQAPPPNERLSMREIVFRSVGLALYQQFVPAGVFSALFVAYVTYLPLCIFLNRCSPYSLARFFFRYASLQNHFE